MNERGYSGPVLPGMDGLSIKLDAFRTRIDGCDLKQSSPGQEADVLPVQQVVAAMYEREVLKPREQIWNDTKNTLLQQNSPTILQLVAADDHTDAMKHPAARLVWAYRLLDTQRSLDITSEVSVKVGLGKTGDRAKNPELRAAVRYLECDRATFKRYNATFPDKLLGVAAERRWRRKELPREALTSRVTEEVLEKANCLNVLVRAKAIGSQCENSEENILDFEVRNHSFQSDWFKMATYLHPSGVKYMYEALKAGHSKDAAPIEHPSPDDVYDFLYRAYIEDGVGDEFQKLAEVDGLLLRSTPIVR